jgi:hypothetical protein
MNSEELETVEREAKYTLLTNIQFVERVGSGIRLHCHAILLSEGSIGFIEKFYSMRGFGTEAAWEVFDIHLEKETHFPFTFTPYEDPSTVMLSEKGPKPIFRGNILKLKDGTEFFLQEDDSERPIDVYEQTGDICKVWEVLAQKTATYWHAPYMPRLVYGPPNPNDFRRY